MQSALFSLQEGEAEQPHIRRKGKQIAHSSQNKLLPRGRETAGANSARHRGEGPKDRAGPGTPALAARDPPSKWRPHALISLLLTSPMPKKGSWPASSECGGESWVKRKEGSKQASS